MRSIDRGVTPLSAQERDSETTQPLTRKLITFASDLSHGRGEGKCPHPGFGYSPATLRAGGTARRLRMISGVRPKSSIA